MPIPIILALIGGGVGGFTMSGGAKATSNTAKYAFWMVAALLIMKTMNVRIMK
jgi:hypothetical protein